MSENYESVKKRTEPIAIDGWFAAGYRNAQLNYFIYILSFGIPLISVIGLVFAYVNRDAGNDIVETHYTYQIRTFWIGLLYSAISFIMTFFFIGLFMYLLLGIWWLVRSVKGLIAVSSKEPVANPDSWLI